MSQSGDGRAGRETERRGGMGAGEGESDHGPVFCSRCRSALRRSLGVPPCEALVCSELPPKPRCCGFARGRTSGAPCRLGRDCRGFRARRARLAEVTGWQVLRLYVASIAATVILLGVNLVIAAIFGFFAARGSPSRSEQEALRVRRQALEAARGSLAFTAAVPAATALLRLGRGQRTRGSWLQPFNR